MSGVRDSWWRHVVDQFKDARKTSMRLFGKLRHLKAAIYKGKFKNPHTGPRKMHIQKKPEKTLSLYLKLISGLEHD